MFKKIYIIVSLFLSTFFSQQTFAEGNLLQRAVARVSNNFEAVKKIVSPVTSCGQSCIVQNLAQNILNNSLLLKVLKSGNPNALRDLEKLWDGMKSSQKSVHTVGAAIAVVLGGSKTFDIVKIGNVLRPFCSVSVGATTDIGASLSISEGRTFGCQKTDDYQGKFLNIGHSGGEGVVGGLSVSLGLNSLPNVQDIKNIINPTIAKNIVDQWTSLSEQQKDNFVNSLLSKI